MIAKRWRHPSAKADEWTKQIWYIYAATSMEHYAATKRNEVLTHATARINLGNIMLSERYQAQSNYTLYESMYMKYPE